MIYRDFREIRAFTPFEISRMVNEIARVESVIAAKESDLSASRWNPLNYVLGTQRDAMARMENSITQDKHALDQLKLTRDEVIESGDTDRLAAWFNLARTIERGDAWREQVRFSQTAETVTVVAKETAADIKSPFGIPWWVYVGGAGVLLLALRRR